MRKLLLALAFVALPALADEVEQRIGEGTALFDQRKYDDAIAVFRSILKEHPNHPTALYELGLTYAAKGDFARCRTTLEPAIRIGGPTQKLSYSILGSCLDELGETKKAIEVMRKGLELSPGDPQLSYNLAVTLSREGRNAEAIKLLKQELEARPGHASGHYALATLFVAENFRVAATVEYLRFLALEPTGPRARESAATLLQLLDLGVERKNEKETTVGIDSEAPKGEGDYGGVAMGMALASANRFTEEKEKLTEFRRRQEQLVSVIQMFTEMRSTTPGTYTDRMSGPFFSELVEAKLVEPFAAVALLSLQLDGMQEWAKANGEAVDKFLVWMRSHREKAPIPIPPPAPPKPQA